MPNLLIRDLDERVLTRLKKRAKQNDRSLQAELRSILERAAATDAVSARALATRIREKLRNRKQSDSAAAVADERRR